MEHLEVMALPTVVREADLYHRFNRSAPLRLLMFKCGSEFIVKAKCYGVGPRPDMKLPEDVVQKGFEKDAFEQELIRFEQFGYEVNWCNENERKGFSFSELKAQPLRSESAAGLLTKTKGKCPDVLAQRIIGGARVMVVVNFFGEIRLFDPNKKNVTSDGSELRGETLSYLGSLIDSERSFGAVLEAFYSDLLGLHITDALFLSGGSLEGTSFSDRLSAASDLLKTPRKSSLLSDCVVLPKKMEWFEYKQLTKPQPNNPAYLLRHSGVACTLLESSSECRTVIVDYDLAVSCSLCDAQSYLSGFRLDGDLTNIHIKNPISSMTYSNTRRHVLDPEAVRRLPIIL